MSLSISTKSNYFKFFISPLLCYFSILLIAVVQLLSSDSLWPLGLQHTRHLCPSLCPWVCSNSSPLSEWCHPTISLSVTRFSSFPNFFPPTSGSPFPISQFFASGSQNIGTSASASILPMNIQGWFPLGLTSLNSLQSKGLLGVFSSTTVWKHQFFDTQPSLWSNSHIHNDDWKNHSVDCMDLCW